jgi:hypothetical protein
VCLHELGRGGTKYVKKHPEWKQKIPSKKMGSPCNIMIKHYPVKLPRASMAQLEQSSKWQMSEVLRKAFPVKTAIRPREPKCIQWSP